MLEQLLKMIAPEIKIIDDSVVDFKLSEKKAMESVCFDIQGTHIIVPSLDHKQFVIGNYHTQVQENGKMKQIKAPCCCDYLIVSYETISKKCTLHICELKNNIKNASNLPSQLENGYFKACAFVGALGFEVDKTIYYTLSVVINPKWISNNGQIELPISKQKINITLLDITTKYKLSKDKIRPI